MASEEIFDPAWEHKFIPTVDGIRLHYVEAGPKDGLPLVLVHGWPDLWFGWRHQMRVLSPKYRLIVPDSRGYGQSSTPQNVEAYGTKNVTDDLVALLDGLNIPKAVFIGHDWGGKYVWRMCLYHPERVIAVCGVCTPYVPPRQEHVSLEGMTKFLPQFKYQLWLANAEKAGKALDTSPERLFRALYRRPTEWAAYPNRLTLPEMLEAVDSDLEHPVFKDPSQVLTEQELQYYIEQYTAAGFTSTCQTYATTDLDFETERELQITIPHQAFFIGAAQDSVLKPEMAANMAKFIPNLKSAIVDNAGHWVLMEQKDKVNELLLEWLETVQVP